MTTVAVIGTWHEPEAREFSHCPSYYAADHEKLRVIPGDYEARLMLVGGYTFPMPQWLLVGIKTTRLSGALYSGFGGVNFASRQLPVGEAVDYTIQTHSYQIAEAVAAGRLTLKPAFQWLANPDHRAVLDAAPRTWPEWGQLEVA